MTIADGLYERRADPLLPRAKFLLRAGRHVFWAIGILSAAVAFGTVGYRMMAGLEWIDAFLNASMILSGMGPVDRMTATSAKLFAAFYALFSGVVFIGVAGLVIAPWVHRLFHWIHLDDPTD